jgi:MFS family permease
MLGALLAVETRQLAGGRDPLLDVRLLRNPVVALGLTLAFLFYMLSAFFLSYGIYLQGCLNWSALQSGLAILPLGVGFLASPLLMPRLVGRFGGHRVLTLGFAMLAAGVATAAALAGEHAPGPGFHVGIAAIGIGQGLVLPSVVRIVLAEVDAARGRRVRHGDGDAADRRGVGAAALGGLFFARLGARPAPPDYVHAFSATMWALTAVFLVCVVLSAALGPLQRRMQARA